MKEERKRNKISNALLYVISFWPLLLSHHPECEKFKNHTLNIGKIRFCIGCFIGYPIAILGMFLIPILRIPQIIPYDLFLLISLILPILTDFKKLTTKTI